MGRWIALVSALAGALLLGWLGTKTPAPKGPDTPPEAFSTDRALADVRVIARVPHPIGSSANARVRDHLITRMTALGLSPQVQRAAAVESDTWKGEAWHYGGVVENVVGVLPGKDRSKPALAIMAHYDSVPGSPGAADDATGVAAALEITRALKVKGQPERDVIVIITDGEEAGLLGARAFFADHPLKGRIGLLINMEARGNGGRANMFQTGPGNGELVKAFAKAASAPISSSLAVFLYENMPNDTDFTVSKAAGVPGLNFAFIGRQFDYHSPTATVANLDLGSAQHIGDQALAAASAFAFAAALPARSGDAVYSQTFGDHILAYPAWGGWVLLLVVAGLLTWAGVRARGTGALTLPDTLRGAGAALTLLTGGALLLHLARRATGVDFGFMEQRPLLAQWALWESTLALLGVGLLLLIPVLAARGGKHRVVAAIALVAGVVSSLFGGFDPVGLGLGVAAAVLAFFSLKRPTALPGAWFGVLATGLLIAVALQVAAPSMAVLVAWPLALALVGASATVLGGRLGLSRTALLAILAALGCGWLAVYFHGVVQGLDLPAILGLFLWLGGLLLWPLVAGDGRRAAFPALAMLTLGLLLLIVIRFNDPWTSRHPQATAAFNVIDAKGAAWRVSTTRDLDPWSRDALTVDGGKIERRKDFQPLSRREIWAAPARPAALARPAVETTNGPDGRVTLRLPNLPDGRLLIVDLKSAAKVSEATVNGRPAQTLFGKPGAWSHVRWQSGAPLEISFKPAGPGTVELRYAAFTEALPPGARPWPKRPATAMPFDMSDATVVLGATTARW